MSTHTQGPWKEYASPENRWIGNADTGEIVCDKPHINYRDDRLDMRWERNAPLIAAAPAMYDLLECIARSACLDQRRGDTCICFSCEAQRALRLVEGGKP